MSVQAIVRHLFTCLVWRR